LVKFETIDVNETTIHLFATTGNVSHETAIDVGSQIGCLIITFNDTNNLYDEDIFYPDWKEKQNILEFILYFADEIKNVHPPIDWNIWTWHKYYFNMEKGWLTKGVGETLIVKKCPLLEQMKMPQ